MKLRVKSPYWTFFWCFPLLAVIAHDFFVFFLNQGTLYLSETGYLLQHYTPWHDRVVHVTGDENYRQFLKIVLNAKAALVAFVYALPALIWINRPKKSDYGPSSKRRRR